MKNQRKFATVCATALLLAGFGATTVAQQQSMPVHASNVSELSTNDQGIQYYEQLTNKVKKGFSNPSDYQRFLTDFKSAPTLLNGGDTASAWVDYLTMLQNDLNKANQSDPQIQKLQNGLGEANSGFSFKAMFSPNETFGADQLKGDLNKYGFPQLVPMIDAMEDYQNDPIGFDSATNAVTANTNMAPKSVSASATNSQASITNQSASQAKSASLSNSVASAQQSAKSEAVSNSYKASQSASVSASAESSAKASTAKSASLSESNGSSVSAPSVSNSSKASSEATITPKVTSSVASNVFYQMPSMNSTNNHTSDTSVPTKRIIKQNPQVKKLIKKDIVKNHKSHVSAHIQKTEIKRLISQIQHSVHKMIDHYMQKHYITNKQLSKRRANKVQIKRSCYLYHKVAKNKSIPVKRLYKGTKVNVKRAIKSKHAIKLVIDHNYYMTANKKYVRLLK